MQTSGKYSVSTIELLRSLDTEIALEQKQHAKDFYRRINSVLNYSIYKEQIHIFAHLFQVDEMAWEQRFKGGKTLAKFSDINFSKEPNRIAFCSMLLERFISLGYVK